MGSIEQKYVASSGVQVISSKMHDIHTEIHDGIADLKSEIKDTYATKLDLDEQDKKCDDTFMKKVQNKIYVKYLIIRMDEYKTVQISITDKSTERPAEGSTIMQAYGQAWITACNIRNWYQDDVSNRSANYNNFWIEYNSLDEVIQDLTMYKNMFKWHVNYTYYRLLYGDDESNYEMSSKCFGSLDGRKKELKEFYKYNSKKSEFYLDVNTML